MSAPYSDGGNSLANLQPLLAAPVCLAKRARVAGVAAFVHGSSVPLAVPTCRNTHSMETERMYAALKKGGNAVRGSAARTRCRRRGQTCIKC
eukprot:scaffold162755_cov15-Tisochrysis_lutea.AAC.2